MDDKKMLKKDLNLLSDDLDKVSGGKNYKIYEVEHRDANNNVLYVERTTEVYKNNGKFISSKTETIYY